MMESFHNFNPVAQALIATAFTWGITALGAAMVFLAGGMSRRMLNAMLGFAAGVMIAVSFWSLLAPSIKLSGGSCLPAATGFLTGGLFIWGIDKILPHLHPGFPLDRAEGIKTRWQRSVLLVLAITLHNLPEGLAVGIAFGAAAADLPAASFGAAVALTLGIGMQNFPEGLAVSMPLRREGVTRFRCFWYGQLSGIVEPLGAVIGAAAVMTAQSVLPYALAFAAGAMMYVVVEELIPESQLDENADLATLGTMLGFVVMMFLDVTLG